MDANANRAREGLRVSEDVARFLWDDPRLTRTLKKIRHGVTGAEKRLFASAAGRIRSRDVGGDLGRGNSEASESLRRSPSDLFRANLKRAQEALRSLEEFAKALGRSEAIVFKSLRYECYRAEEMAEKHLDLTRPKAR